MVRTFRTTSYTLPLLLQRWAQERGDTVALVQMRAGGRETVSYRDLVQEVARVAKYLTSLGVREGDRVVLWGPNSVDWVVGYFGVVWAGGVPVPVDSHAPHAVAVRIAQDAGALVALQSVLHEHAATVKTVPLEQLRAKAQGFSPLAPFVRDADAPLTFAYTSGTTGDPKGVVLSSRAVVGNAQAAIEAFRIAEPIRLVSVLPLSHMFEFTAGLLVPLCLGGSVVYPRAPVASAIFDALAFGGVTHMVVVPRLLETFRKAIRKKVAAEGKQALFDRLLTLAPFLPLGARRWLFRPIAKRFGSSFAYFVCGGAPLDEELADFWERLGFCVYEGYGLTEHAPIISTNTPHAHRKGTVGKPLPGVRVRVAPDGELLVHSAMVMDGYYRKPEKTEEVLQNGWLATGDIAQVNAQGFLTIRGRKKDMILTAGGFNVYPEEIEEALKKEEDIVKDACVVGCVAGKKKGEVVVAAIVSTAPPERIDAALERVNAHLPKPARVRHWVRWEGPFPQTPTLKTKRAKVAAEVCAALEARGELAAPPTLIHESPIAREIAQLVEAITHADITRNAQCWAQPLEALVPHWGAWEWWQLLRRIEHTFYFTLPISAVRKGVSITDLARVVEERPLPQPYTLAVRTLPPATATALAGNTLIDERDPLARKWLWSEKMMCAMVADGEETANHTLRLPLYPHPDVVGHLARLLRSRRDRVLVWQVPAQGPEREAALVWAALVAWHSRRPLWLPHFDSNSMTVTLHSTFSLTSELGGPLPEWISELRDRNVEDAQSVVIH